MTVCVEESGVYTGSVCQIAAEVAFYLKGLSLRTPDDVCFEISPSANTVLPPSPRHKASQPAGRAAPRQARRGPASESCRGPAEVLQRSWFNELAACSFLASKS